MVSPADRRRTSGRAEFARIYLCSLAASVEREAEARRVLGQRLRLTLAERRLARINRALAARGLPGQGLPGQGLTAQGLTAQGHTDEPAADRRPLLGLAAASAGLVAAGSLLVVLGSTGTGGTVVAGTDAAFLVLALGWFLLALACAPDRAS